jgi:8-oxo-dGTP diphosphatase
MKIENNITARGIIFDKDDVILMYRKKRKKGLIKEYYAIPGGHVENNETLEECLIREIEEEFSIKVKVIKYLGRVVRKKKIEEIFYLDWVSGDLKLGGEENEYNNPDNYYEIRRVPLKEIDNISLYIDNNKMIKKALEMRDNNGRC